MPYFMRSKLSQAMLCQLGIVSTSLFVMTTSHANTPTDKIPSATLPTITVTATRVPTLTKNTIAQTLVIDETQLQRYQGQSVLDVLKSQIGFSFYENGGQGTVSNFYLRGFDGKQILVLIDGIRYSSMSTGVATLNLLPVDQIDRIEVLYGASGSSLYGADAMGGVIQVFTKGQNAQQSGSTVTLGIGTQNSYKAQVTGQYANNGTTLSLSAGHEKTDGINVTLPSNSYAYHADKDSFERDSVSLVAKHQINPQLEIGATGLLAKSTTDYDNGLANNNVYAKQKNSAFNVFSNYKLDKFDVNVKLGQSIDDSKNYANHVNNGNFETKQQQINAQVGYKLPMGQMIAGLERLNQKVDTNNAYNTKKRHITSGFVGYQLIKPNYDFQTHVRFDDNSQYGNETTYNIGTAYRITPDVRIGASYATGFRAPTFNELYNTSSGNPNLKAETSKNFEVFAEYNNDLQTTRITGYKNKVKDLINWVSQPTPENKWAGINKNFNKADIKGVSLTSDWQIKDILFGLNYDYQQAKNSDNDTDLPIRPKNKGLIYVGYRQPAFDVRTEVQYMGKRYNYADNSGKLDSHTLINLSGNYYLNDNITINGRINNLTDKEYQTSIDYNSLGTNAMITVTYTF